MSTHVVPAATLRGSIRTPGDKSISHRAVLLSALADGESRVIGCSNGEDVRGTLAIVSQLGANCRREGDDWLITGPPSGLSPSAEPLECGNSGTTMRLLCGVLGSVPGNHVLSGDASLRQRPMDRVAVPLRLMGLTVDGTGGRVLPPVRVRCGTDALRAIDYDVPEPSAQVKSAVLFAGLRADGATTVTEAVRTRANTEEMFAAAGVAVHVDTLGAGRAVRVEPSRPRPTRWVVPGDPSQAAFFLVAGVLHPDAEISLVDLYGGPERLGFLTVLDRMGADLRREVHDGRVDVTARSSSLTATVIEGREIPSVDEVPILAIAAGAATGVTRFVDVGELRVKESDRFAGTLDLLDRLGVEAHADGDDLVVQGRGSSRGFLPLRYAGALDHRMVMAAAVAGAVGSGARLDNVDTVATSYPRFFDDLASLQ